MRFVLKEYAKQYAPQESSDSEKEDVPRAAAAVPAASARLLVCLHYLAQMSACGSGARNSELDDALVRLMTGNKKKFERPDTKAKLQKLGLAVHFPMSLWAQTAAVGICCLCARLAVRICCDLAGEAAGDRDQTCVPGLGRGGVGRPSPLHLPRAAQVRRILLELCAASLCGVEHSGSCQNGAQNTSRL